MGDITDIPDIQEIGETLEHFNSGHRLGEQSIAASKVVSKTTQFRETIGVFQRAVS